MLALGLSLIIVLASTGLVISARATQSSQAVAATMQDAAQFGLDNIARAVRQAGYVNYDSSAAPVMNTEDMAPAISGLDAATLKAGTTGIESPARSTNYSSDVLAIRFFGSGTDGAITNCGGSGHAEPTAQPNTVDQRGWSIYYVATDSHGEPNLYCKYKSNQFTAQPIVRGVESFQVLYRINTGSAAQFLSASEINALDADIPKTDFNKKTHWKKVTAIRIALMIRSDKNDSFGFEPAIFHLFGTGHAQSSDVSDPGTTIHSAEIPPAQRGRIRKIVSTTIQLRNSVR